MTKELKGLECKFAVHIPARSDNPIDVHLVKEIAHYKDGTKEPRIKLDP